MNFSMRRAVPAAALVLTLAVLVAIRLGSDPGGDSATGRGDADERRTTTTAPPGVGAVVFTDVTAESGFDEPHGGDPDVLTGESAMTAGAAVADVDGDGDLDVFLPRIGRPNRLMINDGSGHFEDWGVDSGVTGPDGGASAGAFADVDADGDQDLVVTGAGSDRPVLYLNGGGASFVDGTAGSGLDLLPPVPDGQLAQAHGVTFADYDRDGRLDLLVTHWDAGIATGLADPSADDIVAGPDGSIVCARARWLAERGWPRDATAPPNRGRLLHNEGGGRFRDVTTEVGLPFAQVMGFTGRFADVDADGWDDLLITGDFCTSRLFRNVAGTRFEDVTAAAGVGTDENGMGSVVTDLNADGHLDWFVTSIGPVGDEPAPLPLGGFGSSGNRAYLNDGTGRFTDATDQLGLRNGGWAWGGAVADFANDGRPAVVVTNGYSTGPDDDMSAVDDPTLYFAPGDEGFVEASEFVGIEDQGLGRALVAFDADGDGDQDLLVADFGGAPHLYRNDSPSRHWLTVRLDDPTVPGNRQGVGAKVVVATGDGTTATRWIVGGGSYESQDPLEAHVGLGSVDEVARVEVWWPGATAPQAVDDPPVDRVLVVTRAR